LDGGTIYAVGDVHGCLDLLLKLEAKIVADAERRDGSKLILMLGDYVDRGEQSAAVLDHLLLPPPAGLERICLAGNHEQMMLEFIDDPHPRSPWLSNGGIETLRSYGAPSAELKAALSSTANARYMLDTLVPRQHAAWLAELPSLLTSETYLFSHAGVNAKLPIGEQHDEDLLWTRRPLNAADLPPGLTVVHGHTPQNSALVLAHEINIDTGAYATGLLSAARIDGSGVEILTARQP
jgi:serine/threonine protein phosphatase 1